MAGKVQEYRGMTIVVRFDASKCIHSRNCVLGHPGVFAPNVEGPWIRPDEAPAADVMRIVMSCPSGALTCERLDGSPQEAPPPVNTVHVRENGPLAFHAAISLGGKQMLRATLCRCGASKNKPYCDGSHSEIGFTASGEPRTETAAALADPNGPLTITPILDGPLRTAGSLEICSGTGRAIGRTEKAWLCRCGNSKNKPYCDGSHKRTAFQAEGEAPPRK
jgi:CDGSH-type Zn-finger protein/uncharacterized Fe-S cluster protein YjdI